MLEIKRTETGYTFWLGRHLLAVHTPGAPFVSAGHGTEDVEMYRGNFVLTDELHMRVALSVLEVEGGTLRFYVDDSLEPALELDVVGDTLVLRRHAAGLNRFWFRLHAEPSEPVWGCGEQMSYFDLRGRRFPLWTSEPGVGRDKSTAITRQADEEGRAGGDYWTTNYPQPTYISSRRLAVHVETTAYSVFDFTAPTVHELEIWAAPQRIEFFSGPDFLHLVSQLSLRFGRPPRLPDWIMQGAVIGLKDGASSFTRLARIEAAGVKVAALWCEDWAGVRQTSFGTRLFWDWCWSAARHPDLPHRIEELAARGIRFMGYTNPYLCTDGVLYPVADAMGYLARDAEGATYKVDFGEFEAGVVDLTNKAACAWFAESVIHREMLDLGLSGWMADFGEYLPTDARLSQGEAMLMHNAWPALWAEVNARAVVDRPDVVFFMRAGFTGVQGHNRLLWAGDQCVDFSRHDGLGTVITAALSSGLVGNPYHHSDIGGYTSLFGLVRTAELFMRWTEMAAFCPVMRTHEGNRPRANLQLDADCEVLAHFARFTRIHAHLAPLFARLADEAVAHGWPVQRALFLHFPDDPETFAVQTSFLLGADLLVAPVLEAGAQTWSVYLPEGCDWVHVWSGMTRMGGQSVTVASPIGEPPLFARVGSADAALLAEIGRL